jgi:hypothetical protein
MLEETGLPYKSHLVPFEANEQMSSELLSLNEATADCARQRIA